jgi:uncharacterized membrane protein
MRIFSHGIASAFLALVGISLALAHRNGPRWRAFFTRFALVAGAAALVTAATLFAAPDAPILFGILHCIAAASLLAGAFLSAPAWAALVAGLAALAAPSLVAGPTFDAPALLWLGLGTIEPRTLDWRPLLPWAGVTLLALGGARLLMARFLASSLARWRARNGATRALAFGGRHSLAIYLVHQPILFAAFYLLAQSTGVAERQDRDRYLLTCRPACVEAGGEIGLCSKACDCVADAAEKAGLGSMLKGGGVVPPETRARLTQMVEACAAPAK